MDPYKYFTDRRPNERVEIVTRRHWKAILYSFLLFLLEIAIAPLLLFVFFRLTGFAYDSISTSGVVIILSFSAYYLYVWLFLFNHWVDFYLDVWVVTNERIFNIEQKGMFNRTVSELNLEKIQDVTCEVRGKIATFLNYGDIHIQTSAEKERFLFEQVPNPNETASRIMALVENAENKHRGLPVNDVSGIKPSIANKNETKPV